MTEDIGFRRLVDSAGGVKDASSRRSSPSGYVLACYVLLIALLGIGAHFSKNALAPAQPVLEDLGLSPVLYALIYDTPTVGAMVFPTLWGFAYVRAERLVLLLVPLGLLLGQVVLVAGFVSHSDDGATVGLGIKVVMVIGLLLLSLFRAGVEVVQHTLLARVIPAERTIGGFVVIVFFTHFIVLTCNIIVPRALTSAEDPWHGVVLVQLLFIIPSIVGSLAACVLCACPLPTADARAASTQAKREEDVSALVSRTQGVGASRWTVTLLLLWAGSMVGILHAFQSVTSKFMVSLGLSMTSAGDTTARNQAIALGLLPLLVILGNRLEKRVLMVLLSLLAVVASMLLMLPMWLQAPDAIWQAALLALAVTGVSAPVLSLSMIPEYVKEPGKAYGILDSLKSTAQAVLVLSVGKLRELGGFPLAISFVFESFVLIGILAVAAAWRRPSSFSRDEGGADLSE